MVKEKLYGSSKLAAKNIKHIAISFCFAFLKNNYRYKLFIIHIVVICPKKKICALNINTF